MLTAWVVICSVVEFIISDCLRFGDGGQNVPLRHNQALLWSVLGGGGWEKSAVLSAAAVQLLVEVGPRRRPPRSLGLVCVLCPM
jgi:hypothetical protein